jgi:hypothetical protein
MAKSCHVLILWLMAIPWIRMCTHRFSSLGHCQGTNDILPCLHYIYKTGVPKIFRTESKSTRRFLFIITLRGGRNGLKLHFKNYGIRKLLRSDRILSCACILPLLRILFFTIPGLPAAVTLTGAGGSNKPSTPGYQSLLMNP